MAKARGRALARRDQIDRLHQNEWGIWHWKVEKKLRPQFKGMSLGRDRAAAEAEAKRLNREVELWLKAKEEGGAPPPRLKRRPGRLTVGQLIALWRYGEDGKGSDDWRSKRASTRRQWGYYLAAIEKEFGDDAANDLTRGRVKRWSDPLKRQTPGTARSYVGCARAMFTWAMEQEDEAGRKLVTLEVNPFSRLKVQGAKKRKSLFTLDDVRHVVAVADGRVNPPAKLADPTPDEDGKRRRNRPWKPRPSLGTALVAGFACIQRAWDVIALDESHLHQMPDGSVRLVFDQSKSMRVGQRFELSPGVHIDMRLPQLLATRLRDHPPRLARGSNLRCLVVNEITGRRYADRAVGHAFAKLIARAVAVDPQRWGHLKGLQLRDARRSGFVHLRKLGLTVEQIVNMSGHTLKEGYEIVEHYLPRTAEEADAAAAYMTGEL